MQNKADIYTTVTNAIIAAIEAGQTDDKFTMPWGHIRKWPVNATSGKRYRGINILNLWIAQEAHGFSSHEWATYKQWQERGAQVRKGETGTTIVFWKAFEIEPEGDNNEVETRMFAKSSRVFNAAQVEGYEPENLPDTPKPLIERIASVDVVIAHAGADIRTGGNNAFYVPSQDYIGMPDEQLFMGTATSTPQESYYSTLCHELTHWTGAKHRLDRQIRNRFGDDSYAFEELVAELGAAMLCAELEICSETRADHAQYIHHWLKALKNDKRFIFAAASKAQQAVDYLLGFVPEEQQAP